MAGHEPVAGGREPTERDVDLAVTAQARLGETGLRRADPDGPRCAGCRCYLDAEAPIAYCWHPRHRTLVDGAWVCDHHDPDLDV